MKLETWQANNAPVVLVAHDERAVRELFVHLLRSEGYTVLAACDGNEAMRLVSEGTIDLAMLDVMMPGRTGFAVCRAIKQNPQTRLLPVVLVTGLDDVEDRIQGIEAGADDFLNKPVRKEELLARARSLTRLKHFTDELENAETVIFSLAWRVEARDAYTQEHCSRLSEWSVALAERLGLPEEQRVALRRGGILHDIGKLAVPEQILRKPGPLTAAERKIMETHPVVGERICAPLRCFRPVLPIIRHHHEKMDGSGYPDGLEGEQIPLTARILQTVDVYDALTTERPYRRPLRPEDAVAQMREGVRRGWWDGPLLDEFERLLRSRGVLPACLPARPEAPAQPRPAPENGPVLRLRELERRAIEKAVEEAGGNKLAAARMLGIARATLYRKLRQYECAQAARDRART